MSEIEELLTEAIRIKKELKENISISDLYLSGERYKSGYLQHRNHEEEQFVGYVAPTLNLFFGLWDSCIVFCNLDDHWEIGCAVSEEEPLEQYIDYIFNEERILNGDLEVAIKLYIKKGSERI